MTFRPRIRHAVPVFCLLSLAVPLSSGAHGPSGTHEEGGEGGEAAMKAQHERMARFLESMQGISDAIVRGDRRSAGEGAERLAASLKGSEKDAPHKNRAQRKKFHGLYAELGKRIAALQEAVRAGDLPRGGAAYGRILEVCASCHRQYRD